MTSTAGSPGWVLYSSYGTVDSSSGTQAEFNGYAGMFRHAYSGLYLTRYRGYNATYGRWLSRDPIGERGGINLYAYVGGNPTGLVDLMGLCAGDSGERSGGPEKLTKLCEALNIPAQPKDEDKNDPQKCAKRASDNIMNQCEKMFPRPTDNFTCQACWKVYQGQCF